MYAFVIVFAAISVFFLSHFFYVAIFLSPIILHKWYHGLSTYGVWIERPIIPVCFVVMKNAILNPCASTAFC